jgi:hypothetical protein
MSVPGAVTYAHVACYGRLSRQLIAALTATVNSVFPAMPGPAS